MNKSEWISVEDRLPLNAQKVLIAYKRDGFSKKTLITFGWFSEALKNEARSNDGECHDEEYDPKTDSYYLKEQWVSECLESEYHYPITNVSHWMPLPEPPDLGSEIESPV